MMKFKVWEGNKSKVDELLLSTKTYLSEIGAKLDYYYTHDEIVFVDDNLPTSFYYLYLHLRLDNSRQAYEKSDVNTILFEYHKVLSYLSVEAAEYRVSELVKYKYYHVQNILQYVFEYYRHVYNSDIKNSSIQDIKSLIQYFEDGKDWSECPVSMYKFDFSRLSNKQLAEGVFNYLSDLSLHDKCAYSDFSWLCNIANVGYMRLDQIPKLLNCLSLESTEA